MWRFDNATLHFVKLSRYASGGGPGHMGSRESFAAQRARRRRRIWYAQLLVYVAVLPLSIVLASAHAGIACLALAGAVHAFASVQIGFLAHDFEHGQAGGQRATRDRVGLLIWNVLLGVSLAWWREKHGRHHRYTHMDGEDPDLYTLFAYDADAARALSGPRRHVVAWQAWLFWPVTAFARVYFQVLSVPAAMRLPMPHRLAELATLCLHHVGCWLAAWSVLGARAVGFMIVAQALSGLYMGLAFSTNHLGMPLSHETRRGRAWQIAHTRDIRTGRLGSYLLGGLDLQIEHHLYPARDRGALRALQPAVERACAATGVPYRRTGIVAALIEVQQSLHHVALAARSR